MLRNRLTRISLWIVALNLLFQPVFLAIPTDIAHAKAEELTEAISSPVYVQNLALLSAKVPTSLSGQQQISGQNADYVVNVATDTNDGACTGSHCSLREAIIAANASSNHSTIFIPGMTEETSYSLHQGDEEDESEQDVAVGDLDILQPVTIVGEDPRTTILNASGYRAFQIKAGIYVSISSLTITGGQAGYGGGLYNEGILTLSEVAIVNNYAIHDGGGLYNTESGTLTVKNSLLNGNEAGIVWVEFRTAFGGGLVNDGKAFLTNVTISNNRVHKSSWASAAGGGIANNVINTNGSPEAELTLVNSTIAWNWTCLQDPAWWCGWGAVQATYGGGIYAGGTVRARNTILSDNGHWVAIGRDTVGPDCYGTIQSFGHNLINNPSDCGGFTESNDDILGDSPQIGGLTNNGGLTDTYALSASSPAIDAGTNIGCPSADQRGFVRPVYRCDIGAYEYSSYATAVKSSRQDSGAPNGGCPCGSTSPDQWGGNPINTRTGNHAYQITDISLPTQAGPLAFTRSYSTFNARDVASNALEGGSLSPGWSHNYEVRLLLSDTATPAQGSEPDKVILQNSSGSRFGFNLYRTLPDGTPLYIPEAGATGELVKTTAGYRYTNSQGLTYIFEQKIGSESVLELTSIDNGRGGQLNLSYNATQLTKVAEATGQRYLSFGYSDGKLTTVTDSAGRSVYFGYLTVGSSTNLAWVKDIRGQYRAYDYVNEGNLAQHRNLELSEHPYVRHYLNGLRGPSTLASDPATLADTAGMPQTIRYIYDGDSLYDSGKYVQAVEEREIVALANNEPVERMVIALDFHADGTTDITYGDAGVGGSEVHAYGSDNTLQTRGMVVGQNPIGETSSSPDGDLRPEEMVDANGNVTQLAWSARGANLDSVVDATGTETRFVYNAANRMEWMLTLSAGEVIQQTHYIYNTPTLIADPLLMTEIPNPDYRAAWDETLPLQQVTYEGDAPGLTTTYRYNQLITNHDFETWTAGSTVPAGWVGTAGQLATENDPLHVQHGAAAVRIDGDPATITTLTQDVTTAVEPGQRYTFGAWLKATDSDLVRVLIDDGVGSPVYSSYLTYPAGETGYRWVVVSATIDPTATQVEVGIETVAGMQTVYADWASLFRTYDPSTDYSTGPEPENLLSRVENPDGTATCFAYNTFGQQIAVIEYCVDGQAGGAAGDDLVTAYAYNDYGMLEKVTDPQEDITLFLDPNQDGQAELVISHYDGTSSYTQNGLTNPADYYKSMTIDGVVTYHNFATRTYQDASGRVIATVQNYWDTDGDGSLELAEIQNSPADRNQVSRTYYDLAGRVEYSVANFSGDLFSSTVPVYDTGDPEHNFVTRTFYDGAGRVVATIQNYLPGDITLAGCTGAPEWLDLDSDGQFDDVQLEVCPSHSEFNQISLTVFDQLGRTAVTVAAAWPASGKGPYYTVPGTSYVYNLLTAYEYDAAGNVLKTIGNFSPETAHEDGDIPVWLGLAGNGVTPGWLGMEMQPLYWLDVETASDRNQITCNEYGVMDRLERVWDACYPVGYSSPLPAWATTSTADYAQDYASYRTDLAAATPDDYRLAGSNLYNLVSAYYYDELGRQYASVRNFEDNGANSTDGILELTTERNFISRTYYDATGRMEFVVNNFAGDLTDPAVPAFDPALPDRNLVTRYLYDSAGRQYATVSNYWDSNGGSLTEADILAGFPDRNRVSRTYYNELGRVSHTVTNFVGDLTSNDLPVFNSDFTDRNLISISNYDDFGRQTGTTIDWGAEGSRSSRVLFDDLGRVFQSIQNFQDGTFDPLVTDLDLTTTYHYDLMGRQIRVTDAASKVAELTYDAAGRTITTVQDPSGLALTQSVVYDAAGRTIQQTNGEGEVTQVSYNALGQQIQVEQDPDGLGLTNSSVYDLLGRTHTSTDPEGIISLYLYDNLGRLVQVFQNYQGGAPTCDVATSDENVCLQYAYDQAGNRTRTTLGNGSTTTYEYDALGRLLRERIDPDGEAIVTEYAYDAAGNQTKIIRAPGTASAQTTLYTLDTLGRVLNINYPDSTADVVYTYDVFGNRASMDDTPGIDGRWSYRYDKVNRLLAVCSLLPDQISQFTWQDGDCTGNSANYSYDANGNRTGLDIPGMSVDYAFDDANRLDTITDPFAGGTNVVDYHYDDANRVDQVIRPGDVPDTTFDYDDAGRLLSVQHGTGTTGSSFTYELDDTGVRTDAEEVLQLPQSMGLLNPSVMLANMPPGETPGLYFAQMLGSHEPTYPATDASVLGRGKPTPTPTVPLAPIPTITGTPSPSATPYGVTTQESATPEPETTSSSGSTGADTAEPASNQAPQNSCLPEMGADQPFGKAMGRQPGNLAEASDGTLSAEHATYRVSFDARGLHFKALDANPLLLTLETLEYGTQVVPVGNGNASSANAAAGWQACNNMALRHRGHGIVELVSTQADRAQFGYLLTNNLLPGKQEGDLQLHLALNTELTLHQSGDGFFLLDEHDNGVRIGQAVAFDAAGKKITVEMRRSHKGLALVVPGEWLAQATFPVLVDPDLIPWTHSFNTEQDASIAYDAANNRALIPYVHREGANNVYDIDWRLIDTNTGQRLTGEEGYYPMGSTALVDLAAEYVSNSPNGSVYLIPFSWFSLIYLIRVDANGAMLSNTNISPALGGNVGHMDVAVKPGTSTQAASALIVFHETTNGRFRIRGLIINQLGSIVVSPFTIAENSYDLRMPSVTYDAGLGQFLVAWAEYPTSADWEIQLRSVTTSGGLGSLQQVTADSDNDEEPDIAYSASANRTLVVWRSGIDIHARGVSSGSLSGQNVFIIRDDPGWDTDPEVAANPLGGWMVTFAANFGGGSDIGRQTVASSTNSGNFTSQNQIVIATSAGEEDPTILVNATGHPLVVFEDAGPTYTKRTLVLALDATARAVTLTAPAASAALLTTSPTYKWQPTDVTNATYTLEVRNNSNQVVQTATVPGSSCSVTECSVTPTPALPNGQTYTWAVRTTTTQGTATSTSRSLSVSEASPVLTSPANNTTLATTSVTLTWQALSNATQYGVNVKNSTGGDVVNQTVNSAAQCVSGTCSYTVTLADFNAYTWQVQGKDASGYSGPWSSLWAFTLDSTPPSAPILMSPEAGSIALMTSPTYTWNVGAAATQYMLNVKNASNVNVINQTVNASAVCSGGVCSLTPTTALSNGQTYTWRVQAVNAAGNSWSTTWTFSVNTAVPTLVAPANALTVLTTTPAFSWNVKTGATQYVLNVKNASNVDVINQTVNAPDVCSSTACTLTPSAVLTSGQTYTWKVQAVNAASNVWSATRTFTVNTTPPTLSSPLDESMVLTGRPTYSWSQIAGVTAYLLNVRNAQGSDVVNQAVTCSTASCSVTPAITLTNGAVYTWRVQASNATGTLWSLTRTFALNSTTLTLVTPTNNSTVLTTTPTYVWNAMTGATQYALNIRTPGGVVVSTETVDASSVCSGSTCSYTSGTPLTSGQSYLWRVKGLNASGSGVYSLDWTITINSAAPTLVDPSNTSTVGTATPTYYWQPVTGATQYVLHVTDAANADIVNQTVPSTNCTASLCSYTPATALTNGAGYAWRVQPSNTIGLGNWSSVWSFTVNVASFSQTNPSNSATVLTTTPVYSWSAAAGATQYVLNVRDASNIEVVNQTVNAADVCSGGACTFTPAAALTSGQGYTWKVQAVIGGTSIWTSAWTFTVNTTPPVLTSPADGTTIFFPTLAYSWSRMSGITQYLVNVKNASGTDVINQSMTCTTGTTCSLTPSTALLNGQTYTWRVQASNPTGSLWSATRSFTINTTPITLVTPASNSTVLSATPTYTWNAVTGATQYTLNVRTPAGTGVITQVVTANTACVSGTCSFTPTTALLSGQSYTWRVRALSASSTGSYTAAWTLSVNTAAPVLVSPTDMSTLNIGTPAFAWQPVTGATQYILSVQDVSNTEVVNQALNAASVCSGGSCTYTLSTAFSNGAYTWKIRPQNANGSGTWSGSWGFTINVIAAEREHNWHYVYDALSRVTKACDGLWNSETETCTGTEFNYVYDGAGNLTGMDRWDGNAVVGTRYVYNGANQILCVDAAPADGDCEDGEFLYQYDAHGNLLFDGATKYTYDAAMRLTMTCPSTDGSACSGTEIRYEYSGDGDRIAQESHPGGIYFERTEYVIDIATPLTMVLAETTTTREVANPETITATQPTIRYLHGLGLVAQSDGTNAEYFLTDGLGSVRQMTGASGYILLAQTFDPYGNPYSHEGAGASSYGYAGDQTDQNGLVFLRARYYAPTMGRFMQTDPSRQEMNPYQYSNNNPINYTDPSGLEANCRSPRTSDEWQHCNKVATGGVSIPRVGATGSLLWPGQGDWDHEDEDMDWYGTKHHSEMILTPRERRYLAASLAPLVANRQFSDLYKLGYYNQPDSNGLCFDCARFVSYIMWRVGFRMDSQWWARVNLIDNKHAVAGGNSHAWENVDAFYSWALKKGAQPVEESQLSTLQMGDVVLYSYNFSEYDPANGIGDLDHIALVIAPGVIGDGTHSGTPIPNSNNLNILRVASRGLGDCGVGDPNIGYDEIYGLAQDGVTKVRPKLVMGLKLPY